MRAKPNHKKNTCCGHNGAEHQPFTTTGGKAKPGGRCTIPGCKCPGWVPWHSTNGKRVAR